MDRTPLVERDLDEGRRLVAALDQSTFPLIAAYWLFHPEPELWRLTLSSPVADKKGSYFVYETVQKVMASAAPPIDLDLDAITAVSERDPITTEIRIQAGTDDKPFVNRQPLSSAGIKDVYPHLTYIYRAERIIGAAGDTLLSLAIFERVDGRRIWRRQDGRLIFKGGYFADLRAEGYEVKKRFSKNGLNTTIHRFAKIKKMGGKEYGDVQKMVFVDGRLRTVEDIASHVEIAA